jgi:pimeloyl-ACP methyl ester carboxylesterase
MSGLTEATAPDGRTLEVLTGGAEDGYPLLMHGGTPSAAAPYDRLDEAFVETGLKLVTYSRPGYGGSTPRDISEGEPRIADDVPDSLAVVDHLGIDEFITLGWSGGGPRALACAALAADRCRAAATLAGVAPYDAEGLDWLAGMGPENVEDFGMAVQGPEVYEAFLEKTIPPLFEATPDQLVESFGGLVTPVDAAFITGDFADYLSRVFGRAGAQGVIGVRDDALAIVAPWGFGLDDLTVPVAVWQGRQDAMVPFSHGEWLAANVAGATPHLFEEEGHLSLFVQIEAILTDLKALAGV